MVHCRLDEDEFDTIKKVYDKYNKYKEMVEKKRLRVDNCLDKEKSDVSAEEIRVCVAAWIAYAAVNKLKLVLVGTPSAVLSLADCNIVMHHPWRLVDVRRQGKKFKIEKEKEGKGDLNPTQAEYDELVKQRDDTKNKYTFGWRTKNTFYPVVMITDEAEMVRCKLQVFPVKKGVLAKKMMRLEQKNWCSIKLCRCPRTSASPCWAARRTSSTSWPSAIMGSWRRATTTR